MTAATTLQDAAGVLSVIKAGLRPRAYWPVRELRNTVLRIAEKNSFRRNAISLACGVDDSVVSKAFLAGGTNRGILQFDHIARALGFEPHGDIEGRIYKPAASIDRVAA